MSFYATAFWVIVALVIVAGGVAFWEMMTDENFHE